MSKQFKKVLLHVGWDKTGSTTIQSFFDLNRPSLRQRFSIVYPSGRWHAFLGSYFSENPTDYIYNQYLGEFDKEKIKERDCQLLSEFESSILSAGTNEILLVSYEGFIGLEKNTLVNFRSYFKQFSDKIEVVAYVRPIFSYAKSAMSQKAKQGQLNLSDVNSSPFIHYKKELEKLSEVFDQSNLVVRLFSPDRLAGGDVLLDFIAVCGISPSDFLKSYELPSRDNESVQWPAAIFSAALVDSLSTKGIQLNVSEFASLIGNSLNKIEGPKINVTSPQSLIDTCQDDINYVQKKFGINLLDFDQKSMQSNNTIAINQIISIATAITDVVAMAVECKRSSDRKFDGSIVTSQSVQHLKCGSTICENVTIKNNTLNDWVVRGDSEIKMSYHWLKNGEVYIYNGRRTDVKADNIKAGSEEEVLVNIIAPDEAGYYILVITAVQEGICWFEDHGFRPAYLGFNVV